MDTSQEKTRVELQKENLERARAAYNELAENLRELGDVTERQLAEYGFASDDVHSKFERLRGIRYLAEQMKPLMEKTDLIQSEVSDIINRASIFSADASDVRYVLFKKREPVATRDMPANPGRVEAAPMQKIPEDAFARRAYEQAFDALKTVAERFLSFDLTKAPENTARDKNILEEIFNDKASQEKMRKAKMTEYELRRIEAAATFLGEHRRDYLISGMVAEARQRFLEIDVDVWNRHFDAVQRVLNRLEDTTAAT